MKKNKYVLPVNWKDKIKQFSMSTKPSEVVPILQALLENRNKDGIQWFYKNICTDTLDRNDRDDFFSNFILWFSNMKHYDEIKENNEPITGEHFLCFRCIYHRGLDDEFSIDIFFNKKEILESPYRYNQFLMYNNLVGLETFLYVYEFDKPINAKEYVVQCNNIVLSFCWKGTKYENTLNPPIYLSWDWYEILKNKFNEFGLNFRNALSNGDDLIIILDLYRTLNLKDKNLSFVLQEVKNKLLLELKDFYIYDNKDLFMVPGSINYEYKKIQKNKNNQYFTCKEIIDGVFVDNEFSYRKCYMLGEDYFNTGLVSLTNLANILYKKNDETKEFKTKIHRNNYIRYKKVGEERLIDFDTLLLYRNFDIKESFLYISIIANVLFYLNKNEAEIMLYLQEKNNLLVNKLTYSQLFHILEYNKKNYEFYKNNADMGIKYSNDAIVKKLHITDSEQDKMLQLISKKTAELRTKYNKREYAKKVYKQKKLLNQEKKENFNRNCENLFECGFSQKQIANKMNRDIRKVNMVLGENKNIDIQIKEMISLGISKKEISEILHVSKSKISKII